MVVSGNARLRLYASISLITWNKTYYVVHNLAIFHFILEQAKKKHEPPGTDSGRREESEDASSIS